MKTTTLIVNILMILGFFPSVWMAIFSPMLFDSGATKRTWIIFATVVALPILILITQVISWIVYSRGNYGLALKVSLVPFLDIILLVGLFLFSDSLT